MNRIEIIGNLTADPAMRTVNIGGQNVNVCSFSVAVNKRKRNADGSHDTQYYGVSAWRGQADICQKYLAKGRKVYVSGEPSARYYTGKDGSIHVTMDIAAQDVEFLSSRQDGQQNTYPAPAVDEQTGFTQVPAAEEDLPF